MYFTEFGFGGGRLLAGSGINLFGPQGWLHTPTFPLRLCQNIENELALEVKSGWTGRHSTFGWTGRRL